MNQPLLVPAPLLDAVWSHAVADAPREACGVLAAPRGSHTPTRWVPMLNAATGSGWHRFVFDPGQQLALWQEMDARGEWPAVLYHSHAVSSHYPSDEDIGCVQVHRESHHLILSVRDSTLMSYRWDDFLGLVGTVVAPV